MSRAKVREYFECTPELSEKLKEKSIKEGKTKTAIIITALEKELNK